MVPVIFSGDSGDAGASKWAEDSHILAGAAKDSHMLAGTEGPAMCWLVMLVPRYSITKEACIV